MKSPFRLLDAWDAPIESSKIFTDASGGELWMGGSPYTLPKEKWNVLVSLEATPSPAILHSVRHEGIHVWHPIFDNVLVDEHAIRSISALVADRVEMGNRVLVHCSAGLNRSGLVVARSLIFMGYEPLDAISLIRAKRSPSALFNTDYENWLRKESPEDD